MAITLIHGEHHRNPSGCHNKVKWILTQCRHDRKSVEYLYSRFLNGKLICIWNTRSGSSWFDAFWIANWWVSKEFVCLPQSILDKYYWLKAEYAIRKMLHSKAYGMHLDTAARMFRKKPEDVNDAERRLAKTINYGIMFGGFRDV